MSVKNSLGLALLCLLALQPGQIVPAADSLVADSQQQRIDVIEKIAPSVVAIFGKGGNGGGSGVLVSPDGYVLTNFHVTNGAGKFMKCGLNDGVLYDGVIVGIDPTGDVAIVKLLGRDDFPFAKMGDSDTLKAGDWAYAMGNPFLLATDFHPTVTYGIVSGVHRYQYPAGTILEYTDCIQIDTSINPGNSGGPLFNDAGELVGINGRGSFEKRGRVNSGAGYAISINQIKHFMDHLRSGRIVDHATLGATVSTDGEGVVRVSNILEESEAYRRGLRIDDEIVSFAGRPIGSVNQFKNVLGIYPKGWTLPLTYRRDGEKQDVLVRLRGLHRKSELTGKPKAPQPRPRPNPDQPDGKKPNEGEPDAKKPMPPRPVARPEPPPPPELAKYFAEKEGFANYYFNQLEQDRSLRGLQALGDFSSRNGSWTLSGKVGESSFEFKLADKGIGLTQGEGVFLQELKDFEDLKDEPQGTGGLLTAMHHWRLMMGKGRKYFTNFYYLGSEPLDGLGETVDVLVAELAGARSYWYFSQADGRPVGFQFELTDDAEPCEIRFQSFADFQGVKFPNRWIVRYADVEIATYELDRFEFTTAEPTQDAPSEEKPAQD